MARTAFLGVALFLTCVSVSLMPGQPKVSRVNANYQAQIRDDSSMTADIIKLPTENAVDFVQFSSDKVGWLGSQSGEIYSTTDGGTTWRDMNTGGSGFIAKMQFISESTGWIVVDHYSKELDKAAGTRSKVLQTGNGAETWTVQLDMQSVELMDFKAASREVLWVVGSKFRSAGQIIVSEFLLLQSKNGGVKWIDQSAQLNTFIRRMDGRVVESPAALFVSESNTLVLLTRNGVVLKTVDEGQTWSRVVNINTKGLPAQKLIANTTFPFILAGMGGNHGTASLLATSNHDGSITSNELGGVYIKDALSVPGKGLIACGSIESVTPVFHKEGIVLFSADFGNNWSTLYRTTNLETINSIARNGDTIWAGGPRGHLIKLPGTKSR